MIKFNHVYKVYEDNIKALEDVTFSVEKGEFIFLTGPTGAGKTTILRLLYAEEHADMGTILVDNTDIAHIKSSRIPYYRRNVGFVFQDFKLLFNRSVYENVALPLVITGAPREYIKKTVPQQLERFGLQDKANINPWHISGGEKQKVAMARALILNPRIIMADEPTGNLDEESAWGIMQIFRQVNESGVTVITATHNREIMRKMGKRVIHLEKGRVLADAVD